MLCDDLEGWDGSGEGGLRGKVCIVYIYIYIYTHTHIIMSDLHCYMAETNTA